MARDTSWRINVTRGRYRPLVSSMVSLALIRAAGPQTAVFRLP
jgi:hypothetical protein